MKNIYFLAIAVFLSMSTLSFGQNDINYGFKGGLNMGTAQIEASSMGITVEFDTKYRTSFYAGAFMEYSLSGLSPNLFGQIELQFVDNGFKMEESELTPEFTSKMQQLTLPISLKYRVFDQLILNGGFYAGLILNVEEEDGSESYDATEDYESFDAGFLLGAEVPITNKIFLEARYNHGLTNLVALDLEGGSGSFKSRFIQFGIGVKL